MADKHRAAETEDCATVTLSPAEAREEFGRAVRYRFGSRATTSYAWDAGGYGPDPPK